MNLIVKYYRIFFIIKIFLTISEVSGTHSSVELGLELYVPLFIDSRTSLSDDTIPGSSTRQNKVACYTKLGQNKH